jgi:hypothetical protein
MTIRTSFGDAISFVLSFSPRYRGGEPWVEFDLAAYDVEVVDPASWAPIPSAFARVATVDEIRYFVTVTDAADTSLRHIRVYLPGGLDPAGIARRPLTDFRVTLVLKANTSDRTTVYADTIERS